MTAPPISSAPAPRRILVRGVNWLGDAVMTTPALQRLRERFPHAHVTLLTHEKLAALWQRHPSIDAVLTFSSGEGPWSIARRLRVGNYQIALVLPNSHRSALEVWLARVPRRIGCARRGRNWLLTQTVAARQDHVEMRKRPVSEIKRLVLPMNLGLPKGGRQFPLSPSEGERAGVRGPSLPGGSGAQNASDDQGLLSPATDAHGLPRAAHQIHDYLRLTAALGANPEPLPPLLAIAPEELKAAAAKFRLESELSNTRPLFGLNPGAEYGPAKRWPLERFIAVAQEIHQRTHCLWLILGGRSDVPAANAIHSALRAPHSALPLAGQTSLRELMALLKLCRVVLTNDSGPMHVAAALGIPVVVPFGSTSPELTGPGLPGDAHHLLLKSGAPCSPCFRRTCPIDFRCMTGISVERVIEAVCRVITPA